MSQNWEADKMLDVYIYDYLIKRNLQASAKAFQTEGKVSPEPVAIDAPGGFLFEWWSVFWDIFIARTNDKHSEVAASYIDTQLLKVRDPEQQQQPPPPPQQQQEQQQQQQQQQQQHHHQQQQQQQQQQQHQQQHQQMQMQFQMLRHAQQQNQRRDGGALLSGSANGLVSNDSLIRQNQGTANAMATKLYEERLKHPHQRDPMDDISMKRFGDNPGQLLDTNQTAMLKSGAPQVQPSGQVLHTTAGNMSTALQQVQVLNQQLPGAAQDNKNEMHAILSQRSTAGDASLFGVPGNGLSKPSLLSQGVNQGPNTLPLNGWPIQDRNVSIDQLRAGLLQSHKTYVHPPRQYQPFHMLSPHQQQMVLQAQVAQGNLSSPSGNALFSEHESRRLRMILNSRNAVVSKDGLPNPVGDMANNSGSPIQAASPLSRGPSSDADMFLKIKIAQLQHHQQQQHLTQQAQSTQQSQMPHSHQQQEKSGAALTIDSSLSNSFRGNDQIYGVMEPSPSTNSTGTGKAASKGQAGRKRKQPGSSSGPAISSGTVNNTGPSPGSAPSTPSTHTPGDVMSIAGVLQHSGSSSKPLMLYGSDGALASPSNQLADIDHFGEDGSLDDNVESLLSHDDTAARPTDSKGFSFNEVAMIRASTSKVVCCHFSSDGKLLASAGHEKKAMLWNMDTIKPESTLEEHNHLITDVRFSPSSTRLATSSFDKTVRVWDANNPSYSIRTFTGHSTSVMSLDFHPSDEDLLCSCDGDSEIRYWSVKQGTFLKQFKGGVNQVRFQTRSGRLLAAAAENVVSIFDVETLKCLHSLQRHTKPVHSVCWDSTGELLASVSEDSVRVWSLGSGTGNGGECVHELSCNGTKFHSCVFHPTYQSVLVIGCYQSLELWNMVESKSMTLTAHEGLIASLSASTATGFLASASHDKFVKLWK